MEGCITPLCVNFFSTGAFGVTVDAFVPTPNNDDKKEGVEGGREASRIKTALGGGDCK